MIESKEEGPTRRAGPSSESFHIANSDAIVRLPYREGDTRITQAPIKVVDRPAGLISHHWTKSLIASADGSRTLEAASILLDLSLQAGVGHWYSHQWPLRG